MELLGCVCSDLALEANGDCGRLSGNRSVGPEPAVSVS